jgi:hypothetical protein
MSFLVQVRRWGGKAKHQAGRTLPSQPAPMLMHMLPHATCKCVLHVSRHAPVKTHVLLQVLRCLGFQCVSPLKQGVS